MTKLLMTFTLAASVLIGCASCKKDPAREFNIPAMPDINMCTTVWKDSLPASYAYCVKTKSRTKWRPSAEEVFRGSFSLVPTSDLAEYEKYIEEILSIARARTNSYQVIMDEANTRLLDAGIQPVAVPAELEAPLF